MSKRRLKILFTSAGRRVELLQCFRKAAKSLDLDLEVLACDLNASLSSACQTADLAFDVPRCTDPSYVDSVFEICEKNKIHLVVPTIDTELQSLAMAYKRFSSIGTRVHVSPPEVVAIVQDKLETARALAAFGVPVPPTYSLEDVQSSSDGIQWPMFMKPRSGSASRGLQIIHRPEQLPSNPSEPMILQEFLQGPEFTINTHRARCEARLAIVAFKFALVRLRRAARKDEKICMRLP
jgi:carbamoyl-phosphate synthase large subunit